MSYIPTEWQNGDVITAEKMNKLEQGVMNALENSPFVEITQEDYDALSTKQPDTLYIIVEE